MLAHAVLMAGALLMVLPMLWMLVTSFKPAAEIALWPPRFLPQAPTLANYIGLFQAAPFGRYFLNSVGIALASTARGRARPRWWPARCSANTASPAAASSSA